MGRLSIDAAGRAVEGGVAVGEDASVRGDEPVAPAVGGRRHAHDGPIEHHAAGGAVEGGVAVGEDASVRGDEPVARSRTRPADGCRGMRRSRGQYGGHAGQQDHDRADTGASEMEIPYLGNPVCRRSALDRSGIAEIAPVHHCHPLGIGRQVDGPDRVGRKLRQLSESARRRWAGPLDGSPVNTRSSGPNVQVACPSDDQISMDLPGQTPEG